MTALSNGTATQAELMAAGYNSNPARLPVLETTVPAPCARRSRAPSPEHRDEGAAVVHSGGEVPAAVLLGGVRGEREREDGGEQVAAKR